MVSCISFGAIARHRRRQRAGAVGRTHWCGNTQAKEAKFHFKAKIFRKKISHLEATAKGISTSTQPKEAKFHFKAKIFRKKTSHLEAAAKGISTSTQPKETKFHFKAKIFRKKTSHLEATAKV